ncbi:MAG: N-acetyl-gamma-glutamyl-phosphate reductase [Rickettsiales bacterium]|jgi:N-acetyl-gamma-glutamyl-phosphate reductase|nr:N-acetyl-gamma-glutamyl-phosphate reductase [Rickettsiales bacterium]
MATSIKTAIIGASGYTGAELIRLLHGHPNAQITTLVANANAGQPVESIYPHLRGFGLPALITLEQVDWSKVDVAFCCLPHAASHTAVSQIPDHVKVIDLSADFRFSDVALYEKWYHVAHGAPNIQREVVYGLPELFRSEIKGKRIIACPGCYPTSAILPLAPLLKSGTIKAEGIIIDSKSGVSGAGRGAKQDSLFSEVDGGFKAYGISSHRHMPEIEHQLERATGTALTVHFTPHLLPMIRGILSTIYVHLAPGKTLADARKVLQAAYDNEPFVHITPEGHAPSTREVYGTNQSRIGVFAGRDGITLILVSVIDNLVKGASGQAVQNMNILFGLVETTGLDIAPLFP